MASLALGAPGWLSQ
ncbi:MAG: hypothetical protein AB7E51_13355 [Pseudodesulfovibrio sp.]